jgi:hypothetical protein
LTRLIAKSSRVAYVNVNLLVHIYFAAH